MITNIEYPMDTNFPVQVNEGKVNSSKAAKCVMSMNSKLQKVETNDVFKPQSTSVKQSIPVNQTIRFVSSTNSSLNELGKKLMHACETGDYEAVERFLGQGAPFLSDWVRKITNQNHNKKQIFLLLGTTALHIAVQRNYPKIVQKLLIGGISNNCRNKVDRSALHLAADAGFLDIVKILVNRGANVNCLDMLQMTPLHWAVQSGHYDVVKYLLDFKNTIIDFKNKFGLTPLAIAYQLNRKDIIELIENLTNRIAQPKEFITSLATDPMEFIAFDPEMFETRTAKEPTDPICVVNPIMGMQNYHVQPISGIIMPSSNNLNEKQAFNTTESAKSAAAQQIFSAVEPHQLINSQQKKPVKVKIGVNENSNNQIKIITNTALGNPLPIDIENYHFQPISESNIKILHSETIVPSSTNFNQEHMKVMDLLKSTSIQKQPSSDLKQPQIIATSNTEDNQNSNNRIKTTNIPLPHQRKVNILRKPTKTPAQNAKYDDDVDDEHEDDPVKLLESARINLINNDDLGEAHILDRAIENGHSVVLTDAGKQILKSIEQSDDNTQRESKPKTLTLTPEQFVQMMNGQKRPFSNNIKVLAANPPAKKMVMNKNKLVAKISNSVFEARSLESTKRSANTLYTQQEMDVVVNQLIDAKRTIEEYKIRLLQKEQESERFKKQLKLLMDLS